jgi:hypothetical protein
MNDNAWKSAARAWWERLNEERAKNAELLQKIEELQAALKKSHEHGWNMNRTVEQTMREHDSMRNELERVVLLEKRTRTELEQLQKGAESVQKGPSGIPGDFAALAERIAKADGKHPKDCFDWWEPRGMSDDLDHSRRRLRNAPTWENALRCEVDEVVYEVFRGDTERLADELLDVATVAMRWRRAVMERGSK